MGMTILYLPREPSSDIKPLAPQIDVPPEDHERRVDHGLHWESNDKACERHEAGGPQPLLPLPSKWP